MKESYRINVFSRFSILLILITIITSCSSEKLKKVENPNSKEYKKIIIEQEPKELIKTKNANVKERRTFSKFTDHIVKGGGKEVLVEKINFNEDGNKSEQYRYVSEVLHTQWLFEYDEFGNQKLIETYDAYQKSIDKTHFDYASNGILTKKWDESKNRKFYYEYFYDDNYNLFKLNLIDNDLKLSSSSTYKYNEGRLDSIINYKNNLITQIITFEYDSLNLLKNEFLLSKGRILNQIEYDYDNEGRIIKLTDKLAEWHYTYNKSGDILEEKHFDPRGNFQGKTTFHYSPSTNLLEQRIRYDGTNTASLIIRYEYDFY